MPFNQFVEESKNQKVLKELRGSSTISNLVARFDGRLLLAACSTIREWIETGEKPGSDDVLRIDKKRHKKALSDVRCNWSKVKGITQDFFPFGDDQVIDVWVAVRKGSYKYMRDDCFRVFEKEVEDVLRRRGDL